MGMEIEMPMKSTVRPTCSPIIKAPYRQGESSFSHHTQMEFNGLIAVWNQYDSEQSIGRRNVRSPHRVQIVPPIAINKVIPIPIMADAIIAHPLSYL